MSELAESPKRWWYYRPGCYRSWIYDHGSDEWGRCTTVIGTPLTGHVVIPRKRRACLSVDAGAGMAYINVNGAHSGTRLRTLDLGHGINADVDDETGRLVGVEIALPHGNLVATQDGPQA